MIKLISIISAALVLSACASSEEKIIDKNRLGTVAAKCILDASKSLDDGISPADTVALGVMSKCQNEIDAYDVARLPSGVGINVYATTAWNNRNIGWTKQITSIVLETRAKNRRQ
jgi:hypothetical protein